MKVPHVEVLAKHSGLESCGGYGNIAASGCNVDRGKRRHVSRTLSSEITSIRVPTLLLGGEGVNPYVHLKMFHIVAESDNNIVPEKQANNGEISPQRSLWR